ncbi:MAG: ThiF family adenylyltransferase [Candidatus Binatia bacterium]
MFFSTAEVLAVEPYAGEPLPCARCRGAGAGRPCAVRCPCGAWHHQSAALPCWTYAEHARSATSGHTGRAAAVDAVVAVRCTAMPRRPRRSVVVVGAGNIGSHLVPLLARRPEVGHLTIVDRDHYDRSNLSGQDIGRRDVGRAKAAVQARRARRANPRLAVTPLVEPVENVPLGALRADAVVACVDTRAARRHLAQAAWRLGVPLVDGGVLADGLLARVDVFSPAPDAACLECSWSDADYAALEQEYPCDAGRESTPAPTGAPASLGALTAALQAIECEKLLSGRAAEALIGRQVVIDARAHRHFVTARRRNPACRFDHRTPRIERLDRSPDELTMAQVLALAPVVRGVHGELTLSVEGKSFLTEVRCPRCGVAVSTYFRLAGRLEPADAICDRCGRARVASAFDAVERLSAHLPKSQLARPLSSFGFRAGDVFTLATADAQAHFEIGRR